jgi:zinc and cadmium transporter
MMDIGYWRVDRSNQLSATSVSRPRTARLAVSSDQTMPFVLLTYYCALILIASIFGGMIPVWFQLTHRWMQCAVSFVAGVMLGVAVLHMLPHAILDAATAAALSFDAVNDADPLLRTLDAFASAVWWTTISLLAGMLAMFFIERFFSYHHHDVPTAEHHQHRSPHENQHDGNHGMEHEHAETHEHDLSWGS